MKVLSVRQPYAWLIAHGIKEVENRTWSTSYRGALLIHASAKAMTNVYWEWLRYVCNEEDVPVPDEAELVTGAIVGAVWLASIERESESPFWDGESLAWVFSHSIPIDPPIPAKGRLGLWEHPAPEGVDLTPRD